MSEEIHEHDGLCLSCDKPSGIKVICDACFKRIDAQLRKERQHTTFKFPKLRGIK